MDSLVCATMAGESLRRRGWVVLGLASLPFAAKAVSLVWLPSGYLAQSTYKVLQLCLPVLWRRQFDGFRGLASLWPVDEPRPSLATWAWGVAIALFSVAAAICATLLCAGWLGISAEVLRRQLDARFAVTAWSAAAIAMYLTFVNSALEELHFRAWLDREVSRAFGNTAGILASALAFGSMHVLIFLGLQTMTAGVLALVGSGLAIEGALWSLLCRRPGGIHAAWLSHAVADAALLTWGLFWLGYL